MTEYERMSGMPPRRRLILDAPYHDQFLRWEREGWPKKWRYSGDAIRRAREKIPYGWPTVHNYVEMQKVTLRDVLSKTRAEIAAMPGVGRATMRVFGSFLVHFSLTTADGWDGTS